MILRLSQLLFRQVSAIVNKNGCSLLLTLFVAACSLPLPYVDKAPGRETARASFEARRLDSEALKQFLKSAGKELPVKDQPWDFETLVLASTFYSPDLALAETRWREAIAANGMLLSPKATHLEFLFDHHSVTEPIRPTPWLWGIGFEFILPDADRRNAKSQLASDQVTLARMELASASWKTRSALKLAWMEYFVAQARERLADAQGEVARKVLARIAARVKAGLQGHGDLQLAQDHLKFAEREQAETHRMVISQAGKLGASLHLPPDKDVLPSLIASDWDAMSAKLDVLSYGQLQELALNNRLDLKEAEGRYAITDAKLRLEVAMQYPEISLKPGYEWDQGDHRIKLGLGLPIVIPSAHKTAIDAAVAERDTQGQMLIGIQEQILQELGGARSEWLAARDRLQDMKRNQKSVEAMLEQIRLSIRLGESDPLQEHEAEQKVMSAKIQTLEVERLFQKSLAHLEDVLQVPLETISVKGAQ
jgi:outer membrane protein, heavy metal efflux system